MSDKTLMLTGGGCSTIERLACCFSQTRVAANLPGHDQRLYKACLASEPAVVRSEKREENMRMRTSDQCSVRLQAGLLDWMPRVGRPPEALDSARPSLAFVPVDDAAWRDVVFNAQPTFDRGSCLNTRENVDSVRAAVRSPRRSVRKQAAALHVSKSSVCRIMHADLGYHPSKLQLAQELSDGDLVSRRAFCERFISLVHEEPDILRRLMSAKPHFKLSGSVNKQNIRYWSDNNPHKLHWKPLHNRRVTVWCGISDVGVIGPYFLRTTVVLH
ncbi:hypothetical protein PR048_002713 [Dryococelus australis]|uniref:Transposase n=1 Tax=Dryococelus australis TaxID=614101 RepID=A0ABQ9ILM7_9NEOP|nr:hypothetical protein PR048_002713 [Dryococelus australis]